MLNASQRRVNKNSSTWWYVLKTSWRYLCKTSWRRLEDVLKTFLQDVLKTSWRRIAKTNILVLTKTSSRRLLKTKAKDVFKTSSSRQMFAGIMSEATVPSFPSCSCSEHFRKYRLKSPYVVMTACRNFAFSWIFCVYLFSQLISMRIKAANW